MSRRELADLIRRTVEKEVGEQLHQYQNRTRFRDILGGLGWILGLAGIAFFVTARRRSAERTSSTKGADAEDDTA